jgi:AcrR family transcriptional regulator
MSLSMGSGTAASTASEKRQRQKDEKRDAILHAARRVFAEKGYAGTTIADIAKEARVAAGTVYLYYASKTDLFAALNQQLYSVINKALRLTDAPPDLEAGTRMRIQGVFQAAREHSDLIRLVFLNPDPRSEVAHRMKQADEERMGPLADLLRTGMVAGIVRNGDANQLARVINGAVIMGLYQCFVLSNGSRIDAYEEVIADMVVGALRPKQPAPYS